MNPISDPWFYSSLAQSAAAIVGLIGAILVAVIVFHFGMLHQRRAPVQEAVETAQSRLCQRAATHKEVGEWLNAQITAHDNAIASGQTRRVIDGERHVDGGSLPGGEVDVAAHKELLKPPKATTLASGGVGCS
jgi:hypothetical protein